jgi:hypothetical protein
LKAAGRAPIEPFDDPAGRGERIEVVGEFRRVEALGVKLRQRVANAVLAQVVAGRHLAAEAVAPVLDRQLVGGVGRRLHQHRNAEIGEAQRVGDRALVAEVGQGDDDAVDAVAVGFEQRRAFLRVLEGLDHAEARVLGRQHDRVVALVGENPDDVLAPRLGEQGGEEIAIADDHAHRHLAVGHFRSCLLVSRPSGGATHAVPRRRYDSCWRFWP